MGLRPGSSRCAVCSHYGFWARRFARDPKVIGRTVSLDGIPRGRRRLVHGRRGVRVYALAAGGSGVSSETIGTWSNGVLDYSMDDRVVASSRSRSTQSCSSDSLSVLTIGGPYFRTLGTPLLSGRDFSESDGAASDPVAIVNQAFAARHWPDEAPVGKHLRLFRVAHAMSQRTQEIGIRAATHSDTLSLVLRQGMVPFGNGFAIGLAASLAVTRVLKADLVQVSPSDPLTLGVVNVDDGIGHAPVLANVMD